MKGNKHFLILTFTLLASFTKAQDRYESKNIKAKGDYIHKATNTTFPKAIDNYIRTEVITFDKQKTNISANYENETLDKKTKLTIYLYPVGIKSKQLLRDEYLNSLNSISYVANKDLLASQQYCFYKREGYKINGYKAYILKEEERTRTTLEIYQCGSWFLKIRVTSNLLDSLEIDSLDKRVLDLFTPVNLVKTSALSLSPKLNITKKSLGDSLLLGCLINSALTEMEWTEKNIDTLERASGFPDLYLGLHVESLKDFVKFADEHKNWYLTTYTNNYLDNLNSLITNGFLEEFIMEQFSYIMIAHDSIALDFESFDKWKISHPININLNEKFYQIMYESENKIFKQ